MDGLDFDLNLDLSGVQGGDGAASGGRGRAGGQRQKRNPFSWTERKKKKETMANIPGPKKFSFGSKGPRAAGDSSATSTNVPRIGSSANTIPLGLRKAAASQPSYDGETSVSIVRNAMTNETQAASEGAKRSRSELRAASAPGSAPLKKAKSTVKQLTVRELEGSTADAKRILQTHHELPMTHQEELLDLSMPLDKLDVDQKLKSVLFSKFDVKNLTRIQSMAIPALLSSSLDASCLVRAETGSGKTFSYLIPLIEHLRAEDNPPLQRSHGPRALILAPTRELCLQIHETVSVLLKPWVRIVSGTLMGGEQKNHEKDKIRKGLNIIIATPGRLVDHLQNTKSLYLGDVEWLVLDEADRLLELGFEKEIIQIVSGLNRSQAEAGTRRSRRTLLVSATLPARVHDLAEKVLADPAAGPREYLQFGLKVAEEPSSQCSGLVSKNGDESRLGSGGGAFSDEDEDSGTGGECIRQKANSNVVDFTQEDQDVNPSTGELEYKLPPGLKQYACVVPQKYKLVSLISLLYQKLSSSAPEKVIVFFGCCAAVDFHYAVLSWLFGSKDMPLPERLAKVKGRNPEAAALTARQKQSEPGAGSLATSSLGESFVQDRLPTGVQLFRLHGDIAQKQRTATYFSFCSAKAPCVLFCTDVAARGLDFPDVQCIAQYDPPGAPSEYLHRVGRTARAGQDGSAYIFLVPSEEPYLELLGTRGINIEAVDADVIIFGKLMEWIRRRTVSDAVAALQHDVEVFVNSSGLESLARDSFLSYLRAYATHARIAKFIFHPRKLHLGHLARSFGLQDAPSKIGEMATHTIPTLVNGKQFRASKRAAETQGVENITEMWENKLSEKQYAERTKNSAAPKSYDALVAQIASKKAKTAVKFLSE